MRKLLAITIIYYYICCYSIKPTSAIVQLKSPSTSFLDTPAKFSARINSSGICGALVVADPLDACSSLVNNAFNFNRNIKFALIVRGNCTFLEKVRIAQLAGFDGAILFDDQAHENLISMIGNPKGIWIPAVFVSNEAGETLMKHARGEDGECCIISSLTETSWNVLIISFISLLVIVSVLAVFVSVRVYWRNRNRSRNLVGEKLVELLPCSTFNATHISGYMEKTCAICLQDFKDGDSLKILPCQHKFHANCVGSWLTKWSKSCPVCKYDLKTEVAY
ncbi:receptor homology region, transmembrane domain- and RING domain-containing protein 1 [Apium graveolens]|uniref:receptor homology region, transmembrane domain- and RING domain-containing protein 1 n=1 Tax=Apium graveolens TaxID=4045 RepID=UPI003D79AE7B